MDALQLESASPTTLGGGPLGDYFITLQSTDGTGPVSTGTLTILPSSGAVACAGRGQFTSSLDVYFDVHFGSLTGPIVDQSNVSLSNLGEPYCGTPPTGAELIDGVDYLLDGNNTDADFWPAPFTERGLSASHSVDPTPAPEPGTLALFATALIGLRALRRRHSQS